MSFVVHTSILSTYHVIYQYVCGTYQHIQVPDDIKVNLVFFSTFEELQLPIKGPMEDAGVVKLYEPSPLIPQHHLSVWLLLRTWWAESL